MIKIKGEQYKVKKENGPFVVGEEIVDGSVHYADKSITINYNCADVNRVIYHELLHCFFNECGLPCYANDETLINWLACTLPEIIKAKNELEKEIIYVEDKR